MQTLRNPYAHHDIKPALAYIADNWHDGNVIYANFWSNPLVDYYVKTIDYRGLKDKPCIHGTDLNDQFAIENQLSVFAKDFDRLRGKRGVWIVFSKSLYGEQAISTYLLDRRGVRIDEFHGKGSTAYLYDLSAEAMTSKQRLVNVVGTPPSRRTGP